jgi:hypothetical protein
MNCRARPAVARAVVARTRGGLTPINASTGAHVDPVLWNATQAALSNACGK